MDYEQITVKELTDRAMINRKTFYLHYETLDNLLEELQQEIVDSFTSQNISYKSMADIKRIIRYFYEYVFLIYRKINSCKMIFSARLRIEFIR